MYEQGSFGAQPQTLSVYLHYWVALFQYFSLPHLVSIHFNNAQGAVLMPIIGEEWCQKSQESRARLLSSEASNSPAS